MTTCHLVHPAVFRSRPNDWLPRVKAPATVLFGLLGLACLQTPAVQAQGPGPPSQDVIHGWELAAQLRLLQKWWPGEYDNHEQVVRQSGGGLSPEIGAPFRRVHSRISAVDAPDLGEAVFLVESQTRDDPAGVHRRELIVAAADVTARAIRLARHQVPAGWHGLPEGTATTPGRDELQSLGPGCDILLSYEGEQFHGDLAGRCPAPVGMSEYEMLLGERVFWERDRGRDPGTGAVVWEMAPGSRFGWYQKTRARPFTSNVFASTDGDMASTTFVQTIHLHDQGGEAEMEWPDGRRLVFTIHTRAFAAAAEREYPLFRVHEKDNPVPIAYAYAVDRGTRFGLNLGWFYARCFEDSDIPPEEWRYLKK